MELDQQQDFKLYRRRWIMLALFCVCALLEAFQWFQYSSIANLIVKYYGVSYLAVDWLYMMFTCVYMTFVLPAIFYIDKKNLKVTIFLGIFCMAVGGWIKVVAVSPDLFYVAAIGQGIGALAEVFIFRSLLRVVALWFGPKEASTASGIGVLFMQGGQAISFILPTIIVKNHKDINGIGHDLRTLLYSYAIAASFVLLLICLFFQSAPPTPPSVSSETVGKEDDPRNYKKALWKMLTNRDFMLVVLAYSLVNATTDSASVMLNEIILGKFGTEYQETPGRLGLLSTVCSLIGPLVMGLWLDRTHTFKSSAVAVGGLLFLSQLGYTYSVYYAQLPLVYVSYLFLGFFYGFFVTVALPYGVELNFPEPEGIVGGIFNVGLQLTEVVAINTGSWILRTHGDLWVNTFGCCLAGFAVVGVAMGKEDLKRLAASKASAVASQKISTNGSVSVEVVSNGRL